LPVFVKIIGWMVKELYIMIDWLDELGQ